jgi:hypothetical protein
MNDFLRCTILKWNPITTPLYNPSILFTKALEILETHRPKKETIALRKLCAKNNYPPSTTSHPVIIYTHLPTVPTQHF